MDTIKWMIWKGLVDRPFCVHIFPPTTRPKYKAIKKGEKVQLPAIFNYLK